MKKNIGFQSLKMGVCYYPEHWEENLWESDLQRMKEHGISVIRIAEFAWNKFEPEEGIFTFEFFDRFLELALKHDIQVIFCTPTATPPAWLSHNYPEILNADKNGVLFQHGERRHYNYNSLKYLDATRIIVTKLAEHYGNHKAIIGWQIDNELNCQVSEFYSESDSIAFRKFLKKKYQTLQALNEAWGTVFWNQTYTAWEEVFVPKPTTEKSTNPHRVMDFYRFISDSVCRYATLQSEILRKYISPKQFITTNGIFGNMDNHELTEKALDFITYDSYPNFAYCLSDDFRQVHSLHDREASRSLAEVRSICDTFGIMEQQSGPNGWNTRMEATSPKPGQMTLWTMQSIAHGADFISYFRWRTCTMGTEIYWHGILDYSNQDNRRLSELGKINRKMKAIQEVASAKYKAAFAVVKDYDNVWDAQLDVWHKRVAQESEKGWFQASQLTHTPMDYLYLRDNTTGKDLQKYPVLVYPHATIMTQQRSNLLKQYVEQGGTLVIGCRTGYKELTGKCVMTPMPGLMSELCGGVVEDFTLVGPNDGNVQVNWDGTLLDAAVFNDVLQVEDASVLGEYTSNYYSGKPGLLYEEFGKGKVYYFGAAFNTQAATVFLHKLKIANPYQEFVTIPESCELAVREKDGVKYLFILNYDHASCEITVKNPAINLYTGSMANGKITLQKYETLMLKYEK